MEQKILQMNTGKWIRQPQEVKGSYYFSGTFYATRGINNLLSKVEIMAIYFDIKSLVNEKDGIDYLQVYIHKETTQKIFCIDQLNKEMIASGSFKSEDNHWTILLAEEY